MPSVSDFVLSIVLLVLLEHRCIRKVDFEQDPDIKFSLYHTVIRIYQYSMLD
jgi:hypothetical protein